MKREDYISWDEYFMGIAMLAAKRSPSSVKNQRFLPASPQGEAEALSVMASAVHPSQRER